MAGADLIAWCTETGETARLAAFFASNLSPEYISHSEIQTGRAVSREQWHPEILKILEQEIAERLNADATASKRISVAFSNGVLVALAFVTFELTGPSPYAVLEDLVVASEKRGTGVGKAMIDWTFARARDEGVTRIFLESGRNNEGAHRFFEGCGFKQVSVVMMADV
jgi:GNAT superfamily N-acetyltransferase